MLRLLVWVSLLPLTLALQNAFPRCTLWKDPAEVIFFLHVCDPWANTSLSVVPSTTALCAVESALLKNPHWQVYVLSNCWDPLYFQTPPLQNVQFRYIDLHGVFRLIPDMNEWFVSRKWERGYKFHHLSDALRLLVLQICGGIYLDSDIIATRGFQRLPQDFVAEEAEQQINNAVMRVTSAAGRAFAQEMIRDFIRNFNPDRFGWNGPQMVTRVTAAQQREGRLEVAVLDEKAFYPVAWSNVDRLFAEDVDLQDILRDETVGVHLWQSLVKAQLRFVSSHFSDAPIGHLYMQSCPSTLAAKASQVEMDTTGVHLSFDEPAAGTQFFGDDAEIPLKLSLHLNNEAEQQAAKLGLLRVCIYLNVRRLRCVKTSSAPLSLHNVPTGHHLLMAHTCFIQEICTDDEVREILRKSEDEEAIHLCCKGKGGVTSFTVNFHEVVVD